MQADRFVDVVLGVSVAKSKPFIVLAPKRYICCCSFCCICAVSCDMKNHVVILSPLAGREGEDMFMEEAAAGTDHGGIFIGAPATAANFLRMCCTLQPTLRLLRPLISLPLACVATFNLVCNSLCLTIDLILLLPLKYWVFLAPIPLVHW
jgi:hypothetical protein